MKRMKDDEAMMATIAIILVVWAIIAFALTAK